MTGLGIQLQGAAARAAFCARVLLVAPAFAAPLELCAQGAAAASSGPVKVRIWTEKERREVTVVGRDGKFLMLAPDASGSGRRIEIAAVQRAEFPVEYDRFEVARALYKSDWTTAIRILYKAFEPTFPYLDLLENNAADIVLELGTCMMRAAERAAREAKSDEDRERVRRQYDLAYTVFQHCARVNWSSVGQMAALKGCRCLLATGRRRAAELKVRAMEEPIPGDTAYGHYWLVKGELAAATNGFAQAMDAAVKSICFENKDVETFPDALMLTARCYETLGETYRARDVYFEVAKLFPETDWSKASRERLGAIMASDATRAPEETSVVSAFFAQTEDMNALVEDLLADKQKPLTVIEEATEAEAGLAPGAGDE